MFKKTRTKLKKYLSLPKNLFWRKKLKPNPKIETEKNKSRVGKLYKIFFRRRIFSALILAVIIVSAGFLFVYAQDIIDSFTDSTKIADTWNTTVDTSAGNVKLKARSCDSATWDCTDNSVCSNTLGDGDYIVVAKVNSPALMQWKNSQTTCVGPQCASASDGNNLVADNTVNFANYPARDYCKSIGGRLPTKTELQCIYNNKVTFGDNFGTSHYWSATENDSTTAAYVLFSDGSTSPTHSKTDSYSVRCVKGW